MERTELNKILQGEIHDINRKRLLAFVFALTLVDVVFYIIALIDQTYPAPPQLRMLMEINIGIGCLMLLVSWLFFRKWSHGFEMLIPLVVLAAKALYHLPLGFDLTVFTYYVCLYLLISILLISKYKVAILACVVEFIVSYHYVSGKMVDIEGGFLVFIVTVVLIVTAVWSGYRYTVYVDEFFFKRALIQQNQEIEALASWRELAIDLNHKLVVHTDLKTYFEYMIKRIVDVMDQVNAGCLLKDNQGECTIFAAYNYPEKEVRNFKIRTKDSFAYQKEALGSAKPIVINDLEDLMKEGFPDLLVTEDGHSIRSSISTPIMMNGGFYGLLNMDASENRVFTERDLKMMEYISEQVSVVLENHELYRRVTELSKFDQLTGFYNRWYLKEIKELYYPLWKRNKTQVHLVLFDLDYLKMVNDNFGHDEGDHYILKFCHLLKDACRESDLFIRNGGDEFLGIFFDIDASMLILKMEEVRTHFGKKTYQTEELHFSSSFSYGVVKLLYDTETIEKAIHRADEKMYYHKNNHRQDIYQIKDPI